MDEQREEPSIGPSPEDATPGPLGSEDGAAAEAPTDAAAPADEPAAEGESVTRLALVVLGIAILGLATWWLAPDDESPAASQREPVVAPPVAVVPELMISVLGGVDDRYFPEPCTRIPGGGLIALRAAVDLARDETIRNHLGISMGDLSRVPGRLGVGVQQQLIADVLPLLSMNVLAAGAGELQHGVGYARGFLAEVPGCAVLCANALDSDGFPVLRGWALTSSEGHTVLSVAVAGESLGGELAESGSDVHVGDAAAFAERALEEGSRRAADIGSPAMTKLLLVQGTVDEAAEIVRAAPGFDVVVAARGPVLPELEPRDVDGVPLLYPGRGARFLWQLVTGGAIQGLRQRLVRIGTRAGARGSPYDEQLWGVGGGLLALGFPREREHDERPADPRGGYVGAGTCAGCHPDEATQHAGSPHARVPEPALEGHFAGSPACLGCHVTAAFRHGGWLPGDDVDGLAGVSCERCHGPAAAHVADPQPGYGSVDYADCVGCHLPDKSPGFDARASWAATGHGAPQAVPGDDDSDR